MSGRFCSECGLEFVPEEAGARDSGLAGRVTQLEQEMAPVTKFLKTLRGEGVNVEDTKPEHVRQVKSLAAGGLAGSLQDGLRKLGFGFALPKLPPAAPPAAPPAPPAKEGDA